MPIAINGSGTITGLSVGGLPDGTVDAGTLASGVGGKVLQYVYETATADVTTSGSSESELIDATITPASSSNKILVMAYACLDVNGNTNAHASMKIYRGDSSGTKIVQALGANNANEDAIVALSPWVVDSPSTTSAQEYTVTIARGSGGTDDVSVNTASAYHIVLVELAT